MPQGLEVSDAAKSGDGTIGGVGVKATGEYQCPDCRQKFDTEAAKKLHCLEKLEIGTSFTASLQVGEALSHLNMSKRPDAELRDIKRQENALTRTCRSFL